jgi:hypothetical protein
MKKLTIGSAVFDDFDGVYFSYQSLRLNNSDILDDLDLIIVDNNPYSDQGQATRLFCQKTQHIRYIPYTDKYGTSIRNEIFDNAKGKFCMSMDCHVLFEPNTIKKLIAFLDKNSGSDDLFHGPLFNDVISGESLSCKMNQEWSNQLYGTWAQDRRGINPKNPPFEIEMHGLGVFVAKTKSWLRFNDNFKGFGGEEGYIHHKYRLAERKVLCLPFLRWLHRFERPNGVKYKLYLHDKIKNYLIGYRELGLCHRDMCKHFNSEIDAIIPFQDLVNEVNDMDITSFDLSSDNVEQAPKIVL